MKHPLAVLAAIVAAFACALVGAYVLREYHTTAGLFTGVALELLAVGIALPTPFKKGVDVLRGALVVIVPVVADAMKGGQRKTDPPDDRPKGEG